MYQQATSPMARIWHVVSLIPSGQVSTYGKIADLAGLPGRARYVSRALKLAPTHLNLSWYRVINSQGKISFPENTANFIEQVQLLRSENIKVNRGRIDLSIYGWQPDLTTLMFELTY